MNHKWSDLKATLSPEAQVRVQERVDALLAELDVPVLHIYHSIKGNPHYENRVEVEAVPAPRSPVEEVREAGKALKAGLLFGLPDDVDPDKLIRDFRAAVLREVEAKLREEANECLPNGRVKQGVLYAADFVRGLGGAP